MAYVALKPTPNSGALTCSSGTYATARSGAGTLAVQVWNDARYGQTFNTPTYFCWQYFLEFDLTPYPVGGTLTAPLLALYDQGFGDALTAFVIEARKYDYGTTLTTGDFRAGASLSGDTLLASRTTTGSGTGYWVLTDVAMAANLTLGALNRIIVVSDRQTAGTTPTQHEYVTSWYDDGTTHTPPQLSFDWVPAAVTPDVLPVFLSRDGSMFPQR